MRLGVIAAVVFIVLCFSILYGTIDNESLMAREGGADTTVQEDLNAMMDATKVVQESDWGNYMTLLAAPFVYFDSLVSMAWKSFASNPFASEVTVGTPWTLIPYFTVSPLIVVLFFGLIILLIGILQKSV